MKKILAFFTFIISSTSVFSQNGAGLFGAVNFSTSTINDAKTRVGGSIGMLYDVNVSQRLFVQPRLVLSYQENETMVHPVGLSTFYSQWNACLPVLASLRLIPADGLSVCVNFGPYGQFAVFGRDKRPTNNGEALGWWHEDLGDRLSFGVQGGITAEYRKWFAVFDYKYSLTKNKLNMNGHEKTFSLGIGHRF
jgi:hypothetical protein